MEVTNRTEDSISVKMSIGKYRCQNCGHEFLADEPHPCPECKKEEFEQWKIDRKTGRELPAHASSKETGAKPSGTADGVKMSEVQSICANCKHLWIDNDTGGFEAYCQKIPDEHLQYWEDGGENTITKCSNFEPKAE